jgi:hypothetical protein
MSELSGAIRAIRLVCVPGLSALALIVLTWPMLFSTSGLGGDWEHHLWFVWHQSLAIRADGVPSLFLNTRSTVLYPVYAFYGATIYAVAGAAAVALGNSPSAAYIVTYMLGFMAAYGGWYWMGRAAGLGRWWAQVPGALFVSAAYYLTLAYGEGDWPAFIALSMLPLLLAAALAVLRAERSHCLPAAALALSTIIFFGSHLLTVLWGSTLLILICLAIAALVPAARRQITGRGVLRLIAVAVPAALTNAWFLAPIVAYSSHTLIGSDYAFAFHDLRATMHLVAFSKLFSFSRASAISAPDYVLSLPTATIVWLLASGGLVLWAVRRGTWVQLLSILAAATLAIVVLMTHAGLLLALPKPYTLLQFSYRLEAYVLMTVTAGVLVVLAAVRSAPTRLRLWGWTVVPVLVLSLVGGVEQVGSYPRTPLPRKVTYTPVFEAYAELYKDYEDVQLPLVSDKQLPKLTIPLSAIHDDRVSIEAPVNRGPVFATNIGGGPDLLKITGASIVGMDQDAHLVLAVSGRAPTGSIASPKPRERISIEPADHWPVVVGRLLTFAAVLTLAGELAMLLLRADGLRKRWRSLRASNAIDAGRER